MDTAVRARFRAVAALVERGVGGEKDNAKGRWDAMVAKYGHPGFEPGQAASTSSTRTKPKPKASTSSLGDCPICGAHEWESHRDVCPLAHKAQRDQAGPHFDEEAIKRAARGFGGFDYSGMYEDRTGWRMRGFGDARTGGESFFGDDQAQRWNRRHYSDAADATAYAFRAASAQAEEMERRARMEEAKFDLERGRRCGRAVQWFMDKGCTVDGIAGGPWKIGVPAIALGREFRFSNKFDTPQKVIDFAVQMGWDG